jgi:hypothetical protein
MLYENSAVLPKGHDYPFGPRTTYQKNDIVLLRADSPDFVEMEERFKARVPKKHAVRFNTVATVVGYKRGAMSSHFAVQFEDGTIGSFNTAQLFGPFASVDAAKQASKYKTNESIPKELFAKFVKRSQHVPINSEIEDQFKNLLVNDKRGFIWLKEPLIVDSVSSKSTIQCAIVAYRPDKEQLDFGYLPYEFKEGQVPAEIKTGYLFFKVFDSVTGEFVSTRNFESKMYGSPGNTGYVIAVPQLRFPRHESIVKTIKQKNHKEFFDYGFRGITKTSFKNSKKIAEHYDKISDIVNANTADQAFDLIYGTTFNEDGSKTINTEKNDKIEICLDQLPANFAINQYHINGDARIRLNAKTPIRLPKTVTGNLEIYFDNDSDAPNLLGISQCDIGQNLRVYGGKTITSLEGLPKHIKGDLLIGPGTQNLNHISDQIDGSLFLNGGTKTFEGGENCTIKKEFSIPFYAIHSVKTKSKPTLDGLPKAATYDIGYSDEEIKGYFKYKTLKTKLPELEGIF